MIYMFNKNPGIVKTPGGGGRERLFQQGTLLPASGRWAGRRTGPENRRYAGRARWHPWGSNPCG